MKAGVPLFTVHCLAFPPVIFEGLRFLFSLLCLHFSFITAIKVEGKHRGAHQHKANLYGSATKRLNVTSSHPPPQPYLSCTPSRMFCKYGSPSSISQDSDSCYRPDISGWIRWATYWSWFVTATYPPTGWSILYHEQLVLENPCLYLVARNGVTAGFRDESRAM